MSSSLAEMRAEFGAAMSGSAPGLSMANRLCVACVAVLGVDGAAISMVWDGASQGTYGSSSRASRQLDEYQFTFGQGPCLDAAAAGAVIHAPNLDTAHEQRWPAFTDAVLGDGIRAVFALPVRLTSAPVGALDLFRAEPGPLEGDELAGGLLAAELAALPLLEWLSRASSGAGGVGDNIDGGDVQNENDADAMNGFAWDALVELDRVEVYQATGMLIVQLDVSPAEALVRLRAHAIATGLTASEVADAILQQGLELERDEYNGREGSRP